MPGFSYVCDFFYPVNLLKSVVELERIRGMPNEIFYEVFMIQSKYIYINQ